MVEGKVDTSTVVECFAQFSPQLTKRTYVFLLELGHVRHRVAVVAEQQTMGSHPRTPRRMITMQGVQGLDFGVA